MKVHHLNCGILNAPPNPPAACHCLLLEHDGRLALIDAGIGLHDIARPRERIGQPAIDAAGFQFHERLTAARQVERLGFRAADVTDIFLTHGDPDHAGGLADFPAAAVHVSAEEFARIAASHDRYSRAQFLHGPRWITHAPSASRWFGVEGRPLPLAIPTEVVLVQLFGHTLGHCGVAVRDGARWLLHVGDAYYLRVELSTDDHPVSELAAMRATTTSGGGRASAPYVTSPGTTAGRSRCSDIMTSPSSCPAAPRTPDQAPHRTRATRRLAGNTNSPVRPRRVSWSATTAGRTRTLSRGGQH